MKTHWSQLTKEQQECFGIDRGCGAGKTWFLIPQFIFRADCKIHDYYYKRGGNFFDFVYSNVMFYAYMLKDVADYPHKPHKKLLYFNMATLYFIAVSVFGVFCFNWGKYRDIKEVLGECYYAE